MVQPLDTPHDTLDPLGRIITLMVTSPETLLGPWDQSHGHPLTTLKIPP